MTSLERRARHRAELHSAIIDAALNIIAEHGLGAFSIRAVADRVEYSAAAIYLHFQSKEVLLREVAEEGFRQMHARVCAAVAALGDSPERALLLATLARSYLDFALEHTAYFRVMFDVVPPPGAGPGTCHGSQNGTGAAGEDRRRDLLQQLAAAQPCRPACAEGLNVPIAALATVHGLVSLFLSGRLADVATSPAELLALMEECLAPYTVS
jgi:AcrR family transcriptional regulator